MNRKVFPFPDKESSMQILKNDPCYGKIPEERVDAVFDDAWSVGIEEAGKFIRTHCAESGFDMFRILEKLGFRIIRQDTDYVMGNIRYFCEYFPEKNQIYVYEKGIDLWAASNGLESEQSGNIILAHEFFHYLEAKRLGWMSKRCLVPMLKIGRLSIGKTGIAALSEVAANAFANEYYSAYMNFLSSEGIGTQGRSEDSAAGI